MAFISPKDCNLYLTILIIKPKNMQHVSAHLVYNIILYMLIQVEEMLIKPLIEHLGHQYVVCLKKRIEVKGVLSSLSAKTIVNCSKCYCYILVEKIIYSTLILSQNKIKT